MVKAKLCVLIAASAAIGKRKFAALVIGLVRREIGTGVLQRTSRWNEGMDERGWQAFV